jgi:hypothetical protein
VRTPSFTVVITECKGLYTNPLQGAGRPPAEISGAEKNDSVVSRAKQFFERVLLAVHYRIERLLK